MYDKNYQRYLEALEKVSTKEELDSLKKLISKIGEEVIKLSPISEKDTMPGSEIGGFVNYSLHQLKVAAGVIPSLQKIIPIDFDVKKLYQLILIQNIGKVTDGNKNVYDIEINGDKYSIKYSRTTMMRGSERTIYVLQSINFTLSEEEYLALLLKDGFFDPKNSIYLKPVHLDSVYKKSLPRYLYLINHLSYESWLMKKINSQ